MTTNWIGWMLSIFVLLLLLLAGYIMKNSVGLLITGTRVEGTVVGMDTTSRLSSETGKEPLKSALVPIVE
jgi:P pilus assembly chaperone PapD